jgi:hypothetical protein
MKDNYTFGLGAIMCLVALEGMALYMNVDGAYFAPIMAIVGGIIGALLGVTVGTIKRISTNDVEDKEKED